MHLDITYVYVHSKIYESRKVKTTYILEQREYYFMQNMPEIKETQVMQNITQRVFYSSFTLLYA